MAHTVLDVRALNRWWMERDAGTPEVASVGLRRHDEKWMLTQNIHCISVRLEGQISALSHGWSN